MVKVESVVIHLTVDEAVSALAGGEKIHCFTSGGGLLIGTDWDREFVEEYIKDSSYRTVGQGMCRGMGHGVVVNGKDVLVYNC